MEKSIIPLTIIIHLLGLDNIIMYYYTDINEIIVPSDAFCAKIQSFNDKRILLNEFYENFKFPDYFGFNWDALYDCLTNLNWIKSSTIMIVHPYIDMDVDNAQNIKTYMEIIRDVENIWKEDTSASPHDISMYGTEQNFSAYYEEKKDVRFYFHENNRAQIENLQRLN